MGNIVIAEMNSEIVRTEAIWQYDFGIKLRMQADGLPQVIEVHFSDQEKGGEAISRVGVRRGGAIDAPIPDQLIGNEERTQDFTIYAYVYIAKEDSGHTEYKICIPVKSRSKPEAFEPPGAEEIFHDAVQAVNGAADRAEKAEEKAKESAQEAEAQAGKAKESADDARKAGEASVEAIEKKKEESLEALENCKKEKIEEIDQAGSTAKEDLDASITAAGTAKEELDESTKASKETKKSTDESTEKAKAEKKNLDASIEKAMQSKKEMDTSAEVANQSKKRLDESISSASSLDSALGEKVAEATQLKNDLQTSGEKQVSDINNAGAANLKNIQDAAEEIIADRQQISKNTEEIKQMKEAFTEGDTVNILPPDTEAGMYDMAHGYKNNSSGYARTPNAIEIPKGCSTLYIAQKDGESKNVNIFFYKLESLTNGSLIGYNSGSKSFVVPEGAKYFRIYVEGESYTFDNLTVATEEVNEWVAYKSALILKDENMSDRAKGLLNGFEALGLYIDADGDICQKDEEED